MTRLRLTHLSDEELAQVADGVISGAEIGDVDAHLSSCETCQQAVVEALRGLVILSRVSDPPPDMARHAQARRWALARDPSPLPGPPEEEDISEVGGRGMDTDVPDVEKPREQGKETDPDD